MLERFKVPTEDRVHVEQERIRAATESIFRKMGMDDEGAQTCADVLITNDLRGVETHGVSNMLRRYVADYQSGALNARPDVKILRESPTMVHMDADGALGIHVGPGAMRRAIAKAREYGVGVATVANAGHLGGAGYHATLAAKAGMLGHCMAAPGGSQMVPTFGSEPRLGTCPIAWAAPSGSEHPFLFDIASTQIAANKIALAKRIGVQLEPGWITGMDGEPIMEPVDAPDSYYMLPFGGTRENGSHKGYGLGAMVDIWCNSLTGIGAGFITGGGGQWFAAYDIEAWIGLDEFKKQIDAFLEGLRTTPPAKGHERVLYPGLSEGEEFEARSRDGIPYHREVIDWFKSMGAELSIDMDLL
jgi:LDH2 family malate/lactate/ureidoglycolate dehydrogenase